MSPYRKRQDIYTNTQICHRIERDKIYTPTHKYVTV